MKATFNQHIGIFENAFSKEWCNTIIKYIEIHKDKLVPREEYWGDDRLARDLSMELQQLYDLGNEQEKKHLLSIREEFDKVFLKCYNLYKQHYHLGQENFSITSYKLQKTYPTQGYHIWHAESPHEDPNMLEEDRRMNLLTRFGAYTIYLNNVKDGGETEFLFQSLRLPPNEGTLCIFPSSYTHLHRGNPPLSGEKYIMTGWTHLVPPPPIQRESN